MQQNKNVIRLTESQLNRMIEEAVMETLQEGPMWNTVKALGRKAWDYGKNIYQNEKLKATQQQALKMLDQWRQMGVFGQQGSNMFGTVTELRKQLSQTIMGSAPTTAPNNQGGGGQGTTPTTNNQGGGNQGGGQGTANGDQNGGNNQQGGDQPPAVTYDMGQSKQDSNNIEYNGYSDSRDASAQKKPSSGEVAAKTADDIVQGKSSNQKYIDGAKDLHPEPNIDQNGKTPRPVMSESRINNIIQKVINKQLNRK